MISNRCARNLVNKTVIQLFQKNYLRFLVDSNDIRYNDHLLENLEIYLLFFPI